jgi:hypothetical protein
MAETDTLANQHAQTTCNLLEALAFVINYQKSTLIPLKKMEFLGFLVDSQALTLALPRDKIRRVKKECQNLLDLQVQCENWPRFSVISLLLSRMTVRLLMDNVSAAHYINKMGGLVPTARNPSRGRISPRSAKCSGRQGVQSDVGSSRLEARPPGDFHNKSFVEPTRGRLLCFPVDNPVPEILQLET